MKYITLACDLEEFSLPADFNVEISDKDISEISYDGVCNLLKILYKYNTKITFFVTERIAGIHPDLIKELYSKGHEIGFHGMITRNKESYNDITEDISLSKRSIEDIVKSKICGFKNHKLVVLPSHVLKRAGFLYDNTCHPTFVPGRYFNLFKSRKIQIKDGIINIPISVTPILRLPFSWIWFRNLGLNYAKLCTNWTLLSQDYINVYFHNWDFTNIKNSIAHKLPYLITRNTGDKMSDILDGYLNWCRRNRYTFITIYDYLQKSRYIN